LFWVISKAIGAPIEALQSFLNSKFNNVMSNNFKFQVKNCFKHTHCWTLTLLTLIPWSFLFFALLFFLVIFTPMCVPSGDLQYFLKSKNNQGMRKAFKLCNTLFIYFNVSITAMDF
jgi:hypothetical protein